MPAPDHTAATREGQAIADRAEANRQAELRIREQSKGSSKGKGKGKGKK